MLARQYFIQADYVCLRHWLGLFVAMGSSQPGYCVQGATPLNVQRRGLMAAHNGF